jgi:LmbE family N-acetylglucosaminyl deacetylase
MNTSIRWPPIVLAAALACLAGVAAHGGAQMPPQDAGAAGAWQKLLKLRTTASAMHTTAHPDDEHGGVLAMLSRGQGARVSLLTLTRGESGDNAIGSELFDGLGLMRTEELLVADRYYGVDRQYFGTVVDYGFSKRLDETLEKWGKEYVLRDVVGIIRTERPFVLIARFQGNQRDGHGNHAAAGLVTQEAFKLASDPAVFPEQIAAGLRPWQPLKLYMGGVRESEDWTIRVDPGEYDPVLGDSFQSFARLGLSFQRSQNSGRFSPQPGPSVSYYKRLQSLVDGPAKEKTFFDGLDTTLPGLYRALRKTPPAGAEGLLTAIDREIQAAFEAFTFNDPSAAAPALARALAETRAALGKLGADPDVMFMLGLKERQISDAIHAALGISLTATAQPAGTREATGPFNAGPPAMPAVVPGQTFEVHTVFVNRGRVEVTRPRVAIENNDGKSNWVIAGAGASSDTGVAAEGTPKSMAEAASNQPIVSKFTVTVPEDASLTRPHFSRKSIEEARYTVADEGQRYQPSADSALDAVVRYEVSGVPVEIRRPVTRLDPNLPYGYDTRALAVVPAIALTLTPANAVTPLNAPTKRIKINVEVLNNREGKSEGTLILKVPTAWKVTPASQPFAFSRAGERALYAFEVVIPSLQNREYRVEAIASSGGREYHEGYTTIRHRDLETRYLYRDGVASVRGVDVKIAPGLKVGYVMGVGDDVPSGLGQIGVDVRLLAEQDLATGDLSRFDAIMTGTRAYAVREDLKTYNRRLLEYVKGGGNLIVLYNTQELVPNLYAPYPGTLSASAEEVSEEDSPVEILAPGDPVLNTPNRITTADFDNWVEQRGSKFWDAWAPEYTPLIATWDKGQQPQKGGWLHARYGKGHYTYFAYAFHRQLPYGVPGAYRLLANLLSLNHATEKHGRTQLGASLNHATEKHGRTQLGTRKTSGVARQRRANQLTSVPTNSVR